MLVRSGITEDRVHHRDGAGDDLPPGQENPGKTFYAVPGAVCPTMKLITLHNILSSLESMGPEMTLNDELMERARRPLQRMMDIGRGD